MRLPFRDDQAADPENNASITSDGSTTTIGIIVAIVLLAFVILFWRIFWFRRYRQSERRQRNDALLLAQARREAARRAAQENDEQAQAFAEEALEQFDASSVQTESLCAVCLEPLDTAHGNVLAAPCMHVLHEHCWREWLAKDVKRACPICRASVIVAERDDDKQSVTHGGPNIDTPNVGDTNETGDISNTIVEINEPQIPAAVAFANVENIQRGRLGRRRNREARHLSLLSNRGNRRRNRETPMEGDDGLLDYDYNTRRHLSLIFFDASDGDGSSLGNSVFSLMRITNGPSSNSNRDVAVRRRLMAASANINLLGTTPDPPIAEDDVDEIEISPNLNTINHHNQGNTNINNSNNTTREEGNDHGNHNNNGNLEQP